MKPYTLSWTGRTAIYRPKELIYIDIVQEGCARTVTYAQVIDVLMAKQKVCKYCTKNFACSVVFITQLHTDREINNPVISATHRKIK